MNIAVQISLQDLVFTSFGYTSRTVITEFHINSIVNFWRKSLLFPWMPHPFTFSTRIHEGINFSTSSPALVILRLFVFYIGNYTMCEVISYCGLDLYFPSQELMLSNSSAGEDSWDSLGQKGDQISQFWRKSALNIHWKDWYWSWSSNILDTWCKETIYSKRLCCWEKLRARGEGRDRRWGGLMAPLTQWTWVWENSGRYWRTGKPGLLQFMRLQRVGRDLATEQQQSMMLSIFLCACCLFVYLLWRNIFQVFFLTILKLDCLFLLRWRGSLYILILIPYQYILCK